MGDASRGVYMIVCCCCVSDGRYLHLPVVSGEGNVLHGIADVLSLTYRMVSAGLLVLWSAAG